MLGFDSRNNEKKIILNFLGSGRINLAFPNGKDL